MAIVLYPRDGADNPAKNIVEQLSQRRTNELDVHEAKFFPSIVVSDLDDRTYFDSDLGAHVLNKPPALALKIGGCIGYVTYPVLPCFAPFAVVIIQALDLQTGRGERHIRSHGYLRLVVVKGISSSNRRLRLILGLDEGREAAVHGGGGRDVEIWNAKTTMDSILYGR